MNIGVIAANHDEFSLWLERNILSPKPQRAYGDTNIYYFSDLTVRYIPDVDRARGIEFTLIICVGTWYRRWTQANLDLLREWTHITKEHWSQ